MGNSPGACPHFLGACPDCPEILFAARPIDPFLGTASDPEKRREESRKTVRADLMPAEPPVRVSDRLGSPRKDAATTCSRKPRLTRVCVPSLAGDTFRFSQSANYALAAISCRLTATGLLDESRARIERNFSNPLIQLGLINLARRLLTMRSNRQTAAQFVEYEKSETYRYSLET